MTVPNFEVACVAAACPWPGTALPVAWLRGAQTCGLADRVWVTCVADRLAAGDSVADALIAAKVDPAMAVRTQAHMSCSSTTTLLSQVRSESNIRPVQSTFVGFLACGAILVVATVISAFFTPSPAVGLLVAFLMAVTFLFSARLVSSAFSVQTKNQKIIADLHLGAALLDAEMWSPFYLDKAGWAAAASAMHSGADASEALRKQGLSATVCATFTRGAPSSTVVQTLAASVGHLSAAKTARLLHSATLLGALGVVLAVTFALLH